MDKIITIKNKKDEKFLRHKTEEFDFNKFSKREISELIAKMRKTMRGAQGIGLSANQIGLNFKLFAAEISDERRKSAKFYAVFNPKIEKSDNEKAISSEGCLSVPLTYGEVERPERVILSGYDKNARPIKIKAWGLLARVFQHEVDHLNGILFVDKAKNVRTITNNNDDDKK